MTGHWFGLRPPAEMKTKARYGCRAILHSRPKQRIDFVWDRQQAEPDPVPAEFSAWIRAGLTDWLASLCEQRYIDPKSHEQFTLDDGLFHAIATPNASHGYLYVGAWMEDRP